MRRVRDRERKYLARKTKAGRLKSRLEYLAAARKQHPLPPTLVRKPVTLRANATEVWILDQGQEVTRHDRCYEKGQLLVHPDHRLAALKMRRCRQAGQREEEFDALGPQAREFHRKLLTMPIKPTVHLRRLLGLVRLYGRKEVLAALIGEEVTVRRQRALERRLRQARLPKRKTLQEYDFNFPKRIPKQAILRLFDCDFVAQHGCAIFIGPTGTGKPRPA